MSVYQYNKIIHLKATNSTNNYASKVLLKEKETNRLVIVTDEQTNGKGQQQNKWESQPLKNLTFSIIYHPENLSVANQFAISQAVSLAIHEILSGFCQEISIKWPNDIYWKDKKIAGILIENKIMGMDISSSIIGCGININQSKFFSSAPNPVSLKQITNKTYSLKDILDHLLTKLNYLLDKIEEGQLEGLETEYLKKMYKIGIWSKFKKGENYFTGKIIGIDEFGQLKIKKKDKSVECFMFKEVEWL